MQKVKELVPSAHCGSGWIKGYHYIRDKDQAILGLGPTEEEAWRDAMIGLELPRQEAAKTDKSLIEHCNQLLNADLNSGRLESAEKMKAIIQRLE